MRIIIAFSVLVIFLTSCRYDNKKAVLHIKEVKKQSALFSDHNDSLCRIIINTPNVEFCNEIHYHFVDIIAREKIDSLKNIGISSILFYRDWLGQNGLNGYGKLIWIENKISLQLQFNFENYDGRYGISSIDTSKLQTNEIIDFYLKHHIDTVTTYPKSPKFWRSHDSDHFIYFYYHGKENCFSVQGLNLNADINHLKSQMINKLRINTNEYRDMIERRKELSSKLQPWYKF